MYHPSVYASGSGGKSAILLVIVPVLSLLVLLLVLPGIAKNSTSNSSMCITSSNESTRCVLEYMVDECIPGRYFWLE